MRFNEQGIFLDVLLFSVFECEKDIEGTWTPYNPSL